MLVYLTASASKYSYTQTLKNEHLLISFSLSLKTSTTSLFSMRTHLLTVMSYDAIMTLNSIQHAANPVTIEFPCEMSTISQYAFFLEFC